MTDNTENLVLEQLRLIRTDQSAIKGDVRELKNRLATLEGVQGAILQHIGHRSRSIAQLQLGFDRFGDRVERIEKRLELVG